MTGFTTEYLDLSEVDMMPEAEPMPDYDALTVLPEEVADIVALNAVAGEIAKMRRREEYAKARIKREQNIIKAAHDRAAYLMIVHGPAMRELVAAQLTGTKKSISLPDAKVGFRTAAATAAAELRSSKRDDCQYYAN